MPRTLQADNRETLQGFVRQKFKDSLFVIVSNRQPYVHFVVEDEVRWTRTLGGLSTALDPVMRAVGGVWVAHGAGEADAEVTDERGQIRVPPDDPSYTLQRVWLTKQEENGYYYGASNQALWPLCHNAFTRPVFAQAHWEAYRSVNEKFAKAVAKIVGDKKAVILIQDYHFALLPRMVKKRCPQVKCGHFWHIPWPHREVFGICPWKRKILDGLLGNDLLGFHLQNFCSNFLDTIDRELESRRDPERMAVIYKKQATRVRAFPISVDFEAYSRLAASEACEQRMESLKRELGLSNKFVFVGLDRMDYTKGIPDRLQALDLLLKRNPELAGKVVLVQAAVPSRALLPEYQALNQRVEGLIEEINWRHRSGRWKPVIELNRDLPQVDVAALYRLADACVVSSLQDGMNLVAKEYVSARTDEKGVLLLSRFAGAAHELGEAVLINPYALDDFAERMQAAIEMKESEQRRRMRSLRRAVRQANIYTWTTNILDALSSLG